MEPESRSIPGTAAVDDDEEEFIEKLAELYEEFSRLSDEADALRARSTSLSREFRSVTLRLSDVCDAIVDCEHKTAPVGTDSPCRSAHGR